MPPSAGDDQDGHVDLAGRLHGESFAGAAVGDDGLTIDLSAIGRVTVTRGAGRGSTRRTGSATSGWGRRSRRPGTPPWW